MLLEKRTFDSTSYATGGEATSLGDVYRDSLKSIHYGQELLSSINASEAAYDARIDGIKKAIPGVELFNPDRTAFTAERREPQHDAFQARLIELEQLYPQYAEVIGARRPVSADARRLARDAETKEQSTWDRSGGGAGPWAAYLGAGLTAAATDPVNLLTLAVGGVAQAGIKGVLWMGLKQGAANAGAEAVAQPFVQQWRREAGLDYGVSQAALNVAMAGAFGFGADAGVRGAARGIRSGLGHEPILDKQGGVIGYERQKRPPIVDPHGDPLRALDEAAKRLPEGALLRKAAEGDEAALRKVAALTGQATDDAATRGALSELDKAILFGRPPDVDAGEHLVRLSDAIERTRNPEGLPPGDAIHTRPATKIEPDLSDDRVLKAGTSEQIEGRPVHFEALDPQGLVRDRDRVDLTDDASRPINSPVWDTIAAGKAVIFEAADGTRIVADGQRRADLGARLNRQGHDAKLHAYVFREADGWTIEDARAHAAVKNLREMSKSPLDMARVLRERPDLANDTLPLSDFKMKQAIALARLSDEAFGLVAAGRLPPHFAALVGDHVSQAAKHAGLIKAMAGADLKNIQQARLMLGQLLAEPRGVAAHVALQTGMTGQQAMLPERVAILDRALKELAKDRRIFNLLETEARRIESNGNLLDGAANLNRADMAERLMGLIETLSQRPGQVSDLLDQAAIAVQAGIKPRTAADAFAARITAILEKDGVDGLLREAGRHQDLAPGKIDDPHGPEAKAQTDRLEADYKAREKLDGEKAALRSDQRERDDFDVAMLLGETAHVARDVVEAGRAALGSVGHWTPVGTKVGLLDRVEPLKNIRFNGQEDQFVRVHFKEADGSEFFLDGPWSLFRARRASFVPSRNTVLLYNFGPGTAVGHMIGELAHELVHARLFGGAKDGVFGARLLTHAENLRVLEMNEGDFFRAIGQPSQATPGSKATLRELYTQRYAGRPNAAAEILEEGPAHLVELYHNGALTRQQVAPIQDILDQMFPPSPSTTRLAASARAVEALTRANDNQPLFAFAGEKARTARLDKLAAAQDLELEGKTNFEIWQKTGWQRGGDGRWKFEIADADAKLKPEASSVVSGRLAEGVSDTTTKKSRPEATIKGKAGDLIDHPLLFEAYPKAKNIDMTISRERMATGGEIDLAKNKITIAAANPSQARLIALHELQHWIQRHEGFAEGAAAENMGVILRKAAWDLDSHAARVIDELDALVREVEIGRADPAHGATISALRQQLSELNRQRHELELGGYHMQYRRLAGEVEARNVERRADMPRGERRGTSPARSEDVAREDQVIIRGQRIQRAEDEPDWQAEQWAALERGSAAFEHADWQRNTRPVFEKAVKSQAERSVEAFTRQVQVFEKGLLADGLTPAQIAQAIEKKFGFAVDADELARRQVWWRLDERTGGAEPRGKAAPRTDRAAMWTRATNAALGRIMQAGPASAVQAAGRLSAMTGRTLTAKEVGRQIDRLGLGRRASAEKATSGIMSSPEVTAVLRSAEIEGLTTQKISDLLSRRFDADITKNMVVGRLDRLRDEQARAHLDQDLAAGDAAQVLRGQQPDGTAKVIGQAKRNDELGDLVEVCKK